MDLPGEGSPSSLLGDLFPCECAYRDSRPWCRDTIERTRQTHPVGSAARIGNELEAPRRLEVPRPPRKETDGQRRANGWGPVRHVKARATAPILT